MEWRDRESDAKTYIKINWEEAAASRLLDSLKSNVPKASEAIYDYVSKYHLGDASSELRKSLQNDAEHAIRMVDEMNVNAQRVTRDTYQSLYKKMLAQESQSIPEKLKKMVLGSLVRVTQKYHMAVTWLMDSVIHFLKFNRVQFPGNAGTYTVDELYTIVMRETKKLLSQLFNGLGHLFSYVQDQVEKSRVINDITFKCPFSPTPCKLKDVLLIFREDLNILSNLGQQDINFTTILSDFQSSLERLLDIIEEKIECLKNNESTCVPDHINMFFKTHIPFAFKSLRENIYSVFSEFNDFVQSILQEGSYKLQQVHQYMKAFREEYFDPSMVGWTVKYYEIEEKMVDLIKNLLAPLRDFYSEYSVTAADFASKMSTQVEQFVSRDIREYLSMLADINGKGREKVAELSIVVKERIKSWSTAVAEITSDYLRQLHSKLQDFSDQLSGYYEKFIAESTRLIDLSIQNYHVFLRYIAELLKKLQGATANNVSPYLRFAQGELIITF